MQLRCSSTSPNDLYSLTIACFALVLISTQALAEIWINQAPGYSQLPQCAEARLSAVVRGQSSGCGQITSYSCFCEQSYTTMNKIIATAVSSACDDISYANFALDVFRAYCQSLPLTPFLTTAAAIPPTFIDALTTSSVITTLLTTALKAPSTLPPMNTSPSTSFALNVESRSTIPAPSVGQSSLSPSTAAPFSSTITTLSYHISITTPTETSPANQSLPISSEVPASGAGMKPVVIVSVVVPTCFFLVLGCVFFQRRQRRRKEQQRLVMSNLEYYLQRARVAKNTRPKSEEHVDNEYVALLAASENLAILLQSGKADVIYQRTLDVHRSLLENRLERVIMSPSSVDIEESLLRSHDNLMKMSKQSKYPEISAFAHFDTGHVNLTRARIWEWRNGDANNTAVVQFYSTAMLEFDKAATELLRIPTSTSQIHLYHVRSLIGYAIVVGKVPRIEILQPREARNGEVCLNQARAILNNHVNDALLMGEMLMVDKLLRRS